ncbi:peptidase U62 modulator of DNA gyrase [Desulfurococcus mucosus DSM 2162]|uniref:Peptidase U62 modulator of DNA gyrase n=1 Tax=Desulfurococcus mucosus (strain ATCC 35584 / DSM 2162 / JCM 9187 / O7/1) TaxID=765177 RepID=E8R7W2_DESM0|nr:peptidase U62 modulator of DNA gyrase [Desulfurococcus mucosus DSM 2162]
MEVVEAVLEKLVEAGVGKGLSEVEAYSVESSILSLTVSSNKVKEASRSRIVTTGLRGAIGRRVGGLALTALNVDPVEVAGELARIAGAAPEDPYWPGFPTPLHGTSRALCLDKRIAELSEEEAVEILLNAMEAMRSAAISMHVDEAVVVEGSLNMGSQRYRVVNSHGVDADAECTFISLWLTLSVKTSRGSSDKSVFTVRRGLDEQYLMERSREAGELAPLFAGARPVESGVYDVILTPESAGLILSTLLTPAFSALNILESRSPLKGKVGEEVVSPVLTITDDPTLPLETGSRGFDDEGVGTRMKVILDKGVFKQPLHSYYTASRMGDEPTGNGFRRVPGSPTQPGATNMVVQPVRGSLEDFTREAGRALVVYEMIGYWMSNPVNGVVKATVSHGLLVEKGEVVKPVKGVVITGNIYEWLGRGLIGVGSDLRINNGVGSPSIWVSRVNVAGE